MTSWHLLYYVSHNLLLFSVSPALSESYIYFQCPFQLNSFIYKVTFRIGKWPYWMLNYWHMQSVSGVGDPMVLLRLREWISVKQVKMYLLKIHHGRYLEFHQYNTVSTSVWYIHMQMVIAARKLNDTYSLEQLWPI